VEELLLDAVQSGAQEVLLQPGRCPIFVARGQPIKTGTTKFDASDMTRLLKSVASERDQEVLNNQGQVLFFASYGDTPFGISACHAMGDISMVLMLRPVPADLPEAAQKHLSDWLRAAAGGLCVFLGPPNAGKSQAIYSAVQKMAEDASRRIMVVSRGLLPVFSGAAWVVCRRLDQDGSCLSDFVGYAILSRFNSAVFSHPDRSVLPAAIRTAVSGLTTMVTVTAQDALSARAIMLESLEQDKSPALREAFQQLRTLYGTVSWKDGQMDCSFDA